MLHLKENEIQKHTVSTYVWFCFRHITFSYNILKNNNYNIRSTSHYKLVGRIAIKNCKCKGLQLLEILFTRINLFTPFLKDKTHLVLLNTKTPSKSVISNRVVHNIMSNKLPYGMLTQYFANVKPPGFRIIMS